MEHLYLILFLDRVLNYTLSSISLINLYSTIPIKKLTFHESRNEEQQIFLQLVDIMIGHVFVHKYLQNNFLLKGRQLSFKR